MKECLKQMKNLAMRRRFNVPMLIFSLVFGCYFALLVLGGVAGGNLSGLIYEWTSYLFGGSLSALFPGVPLAISLALTLAFLSGFGISAYIREVDGGFDVYRKVMAKVKNDSAKGGETGPSAAKDHIPSASEINNVIYASRSKKASIGSQGGDDDVKASDEALASLFLTASITPREIYTCIDERLTTSDRYLGIESYITFRIPYNFQRSPFVIPAFFHYRGAYPDSLTVAEVSGDKVSILNLTESIDYMEWILDTCLPGIRENDKLWQRIEEFVADSCSMSKEVVRKRSKLAKELVEDTREYFKSEHYNKRLKVFEEFIYLLIESYPICLRCVAGPVDDDKVQDDYGCRLRYRANRARSATLRLCYRAPLVSTSSVVEENKKALGSYRKFWDKLRTFLGKRPNTFYYGLGSADRTQSYHFQASGAADLWDSYCSMVALRRRAASAPNVSVEGSSSSANAEFVDYPRAEMAFIQTRFGQSDLSLSVKNGSGFRGWYILFRLAPKMPASHMVALLASFLAGVMLWACLISVADFQKCSIAGLVVTILAAVCSSCVAWMFGRSGSARGSEKAPFLAALLILAASIVSLLFLASQPDVDWFLRCLMELIFALLCATCVAFLSYCFARFGIISSFRRGEVAQVSLTDENDPNDDDVKHSYGRGSGREWSAGWMTVDGDRYITERASEGVCIQEEEGVHPKWVLHAFVNERKPDEEGAAKACLKQAISPLSRLKEAICSRVRRSHTARARVACRSGASGELKNWARANASFRAGNHSLDVNAEVSFRFGVRSD